MVSSLLIFCTFGLESNVPDSRTDFVCEGIRDLKIHFGIRFGFIRQIWFGLGYANKKITQQKTGRECAVSLGVLSLDVWRGV